MKNIPLKISLIVFLIGTLIIIILADTLEPKTIPISNISEKNLDEYVKIQGNVTSIKEFISEDSKSILVLATIKDDSGLMTLLLRKRTSLKEGQEAQIIGKVSEYENKLEIEVLRIV